MIAGFMKHSFIQAKEEMETKKLEDICSIELDVQRKIFFTKEKILTYYIFEQYLNSMFRIVLYIYTLNCIYIQRHSYVHWRM